MKNSLVSSNSEMPVYDWVNSNASLLSLCKTLNTTPIVTLDTEFVRERTYFPQAGLIQVATDRRIWLIDPLAISHWKPFAAWLQASSTLKILHACREDLDLFSTLVGVLPQPIFDTQLAAGFCGLGFGMGLQRLVQALLDLYISKEQVRSNWLQRPLTYEQCQYAAADSWYLMRCYKKLLLLLQHTPKMAWLKKDCEQLVQEHSISKDWRKKQTQQTFSS